MSKDLYFLDSNCVFTTKKKALATDRPLILEPQAMGNKTNYEDILAYVFQMESNVSFLCFFMSPFIAILAMTCVFQMESEPPFHELSLLNVLFHVTKIKHEGNYYICRCGNVDDCRIM